jgi:S1-C subfamily serine protease
MFRLWLSLFAGASFSLLAEVGRGDTPLPEKTLQDLKAATVFVKVEADQSAKFQMRREDGSGERRIEINGGRYKASGSGFIIKVEGDVAYVVTNHHVVTPSLKIEPQDLPASRLRPGSGRLLRPSPDVAYGPVTVSLPNQTIAVVFHSGTKQECSMPAQVAALDPGRDLAILKVAGVKDLPKPLNLERAPKLVETTPVYVLGFPFGEALATSTGNPTITVGRGTVSSVRLKDNGDIAVVQIDGALNSGNSGGPIVDGEGRLVGVAVATIRGATGIGFAVPAHELTRMLAGRVAKYHLFTTKVEKNKFIVHVEMGLIDPLHKIDQATFHYIRTDALKSRPGSGKPVSTLPAGQKVDLTIQEQTAVGQFDLTIPEHGEVSLTFQVSFRNGDNQLAFTPLVAYRVKAIEKTTAQATSTPSPKKFDAREAHRKLPRYGTNTLTEEHIQAILACLQDNSDYWRGQAVNHIQEADVVESHRNEIARRLVDELKESDAGIQVQAVKALARWATKDSIEPLIQFVDATGDDSVRNTALEALGKLKDPRAIETIVEYLPKGSARQKASWALKNFGPVAEDKVAAALAHKNKDVRREACLILKAIGTAKSLPALEAALNDESRPVSEAAEDAIRVIKKR